MPDPSIDHVADELYALAPPEFIAARGEAVKRARDDGERETAAAIGKLQKPTVAAWLVNLLVREEPEQLQQFVELGGSLREAAESLDGDELKALNRQRRQIVLALVRQAAAIGRAHGQRTSAQVEDEIRETLEAALADPEIGAVVLEGRLAKSVQYAGFGAPSTAGASGSVGTSRSVGTAGPSGQAGRAAPPRAAPEPEPVPDLTALRRERARKALDDAERQLRRAERERDAEAGRVRAAEARRDELDAKVARVRGELAELERQLESASATHDERQRDLDVAERALASASAERSKASDELARLTR